MNDLSFQKFSEALNEGRLDDAEQIALSELHSNAENWNTIYLLGIIRRKRGDLRGALSRYYEALSLKPHFAPILRACGIAHQQLGEFDYAITAFLEALSQEPKNVEGLNSLGLTYRKMGKYQHALYYYCIAVDLCLKLGHQRVRDEGLVREVINPDGTKMTLMEHGAYKRFPEAVLETPYITIIENIGVVLGNMGDTEKANYFFRTADEKNHIDEHLLHKIYENAGRASGLSSN